MATALIIGAGPAGLTAAYELTKMGIRPHVMEADDIVGGLSRTVEYRGYRFDIGGHRFFSKVPLVNELWHEILGDDLLRRPRLSRIYYRGHFFDYPLRPLNALLGLGPIEAIRVVASYARARLRPEAEERSLEQWVSNRFGRRLYEIFFKTYTEKVWGTPCSEISADWAAQRIKNFSLAEALRAALLGSRSDESGQVITTLIDEFLYPRFGPGMMWERCAELVQEGGGELSLGMRAERIKHEKGRVVAIEGRGSDGATARLSADHFISTMPVRDLIRALDPPPPAEVREAAEQLTYRDYLAVALIVKRPEVFPDNWVYVHAPEVRLGRIQNYKNWSPQMVPDASRTALGLEYFLWESDPEWTWPEERLIEAGIRDCEHIGILDRADVEDGTVVRVPKAYPVYDHHYHEHLAVIRGWLEGIENLQLVGRNGQHRYNNQDHSMLAGVFAARNLNGSRHDVWAVNTEASYHEEGVVEAPSERMVPTALRPQALDADDQVVEQVLAPLDPVALGVAFGVVAGGALFLATVILLLKGGAVVGPTLALLAEYLPGFRVSWGGALLGFCQTAAAGFALGWATARLRNYALFALARAAQQRAESKLRERILDEI